MASRRKSRILAFQALYFWESNKVPVEELVNFAWLDEDKLKNLNEEMSAFARLITTGAIENIGAVDEMIKKHLQNWDITRLNRVDLAILRISVYTLMFQRDISPSIVIDEAIGICVEFGANDSFKFVNGVLDSIRITLQQTQAAQT
jgi:N utilization substance protein B